MTISVIGVFDSEKVAEEAVNDLRRAGFDREISILAKGKENDKARIKDENKATMGVDADQTDFETGDLASGTTTGGVIGGLAGLAAGAGALVIPGLGPLVAAGPIAGLLSGAASGGVAGALIDWGIPETEGRRYEEQIKQGKILVSVNTDEDHVDSAKETLENHGAEEVKEHKKQ